ncbi:MAG TPA: fumarylacetoacetate hydrolase family protein [Pseudolabrys sp.]
MTTAAALPIPQLRAAVVPIVGVAESFPVRRIYCVGRNYLEHIREMKEGDERDPPFFFQKPTDSVVVDGVVPYPTHTSDFQYEVELVAAIGHTAHAVSISQALDVVFGYAVGLDMTRRDRQREAAKKGLAWEIGKSFDFSAPCGPIHLTSRVGHIGKGPIELRVGGKIQQKSVLEKMIWNVPEIISHLSHQYTLMPGDLIFTGTPAGVGPVVPGDTLTAEIEGLSPLTVRITESTLHPR